MRGPMTDDERREPGEAERDAAELLIFEDAEDARYLHGDRRPGDPIPCGILSASGVDVDMTEAGFVTTYYRECVDCGHRVEARNAIPTLPDCPNCGEPFTRILEGDDADDLG